MLKIADRVTVLRDGKTVGGGAIGELSRKDIVRMMVGRELTEFYPKERHVDMSQCVLEVKNFRLTDRLTGKLMVTDASFRLYRGEILGLFGLVGAGRTELTSSLYGSPPGEIRR